MKNHLQLVVLLMVMGLCALQSYALPTWTFTVVVAVEKQTADYYQKMYSKDIAVIVREQMERVNAKFNTSNNFNGIYNFRVDSIYVFNGPAKDEVFKPHPRFDYNLVINGFPDNSIGRGWLGSNQTIGWPWDYFDETFGDYSTDGLTHEFGHARGAIDIYGLRVEGANNPVNGATFEPINSIMNYPYGNSVWDEHTTHLLNSTGGDFIKGDQWIATPFPKTIGLKAVNASGVPLNDVRLTVYPVEWFSYRVQATHILSENTNAQGVYQFRANPFQPTAIGYPWNMRYCNFLVKAVHDGVTVYRWLPLYEVQNDYFRNGANSDYRAEIVFPNPTQSIKITNLNSTAYWTGATVEATFATSGVFEPGNQFTLEIVDNANNLTSFGKQNGSTVSGVITAVRTNPQQTYVLRVVSSKPRIRSEDIPIQFIASPLKLNIPYYNCQTGSITFFVTGGDQSPVTFTAPGVTRTSATSYMGTVEAELRNDPKPILIQATQNGQTSSLLFDFGAYCQRTTPPPTSGSSLTLLTPAYNCATGAITFNTRGGDGSPITYAAPGIIRTSLLASTGTVERELRNDPKPILIQATQHGQTASLLFDFGAYCQQLPTNGPLALVAPTYDCATGAIRFNTTGGDGSPIEYAAAGITGWTTGPNQFVDRESRTASDVQPFTLLARQGGVVVSYVWNLKVACGRARQGAPETGSGLSVRVLGNPVNDVLRVMIEGVAGQSLDVRLIDLSGHLVESRVVELTEDTDYQQFDLRKQRVGLLLLRVSSGIQSRTVKIVKQ